MALFKIAKGQKANLPSTKTEGYAYVTSDERKMYIDTVSTDTTNSIPGTRIALNSDITDRLFYATCNTAAGTADKIVEISNSTFYNADDDIKEGSILVVNFTYTNTASGPKLKIGMSGTARPILRSGESISAGTTIGDSWAPGSAVPLIFDGTAWRLLASGGNQITSTDNAVPKFNGTSGALQNTEVIISDSNIITAAGFSGPLTGNATSADKVNHTLTVYSNSGITEGTDKYTFDGSADKILNLLPGNNVSLTADAGSITFSSPSLSGGATSSGDAKLVGGVTVSGHTISVAKKTVTAGSGLTVDGTTTAITIGHSNSVTGATLGSTQTAAFGSTFTIPKFTYDSEGHITAGELVNINMPANPNTDFKVQQDATTDTNYRNLILSYHNSSSQGTASGSLTNIVYTNANIYAQPSSGSLFATTFNGALVGNADTATSFASTKNIALTGDITGNADGGDGDGWSITTTIGDEKVTNAMLAGAIENAKLINSKITLAGRDVALGGAISKADMLSDLGLSYAMHFLGVTTTAMSDGETTANVTVNAKIITPLPGDVVLDDDTHYEYVWTGSYWELLGGDSSYKILQDVVSDPNVGSAIDTLAFINSITQNANGEITVTKQNVREASDVQSGIVSTGTQTFAGAKTFNSIITGDITGNAGSADRLNITSTDNAIARFDGTTGIVQDSKLYLDDDASLNMDNKFKTWLYTFDYDDLNQPMQSLALQAQDGYFSIVEIQAPAANPKEATLCLKTEGTVSGGRPVESFADISFTQYNSAQPTFALVGQKRGSDVYPKFTIGFSDGDAWEAFAINPKNEYNGEPDKRAWFADDIYIGGGSGSEIDIYSHKVVKEGRLPYDSSDPTTADGQYSVAIGNENQASGKYAAAIGARNNISGKYGFGVGCENAVSGETASAIGSNNSILADYGFAVGDGNTVSADSEYGIALGAGNTISNANGIAIGGDNTSSGEYGVTIGYGNEASGEISIAIGSSNTVSAYGTVATGADNINSGSTAFVTGSDNNNSGWASLLAGSENTGAADLSFLFGTHNNTTTDGESGVALGNYNSISGYGAAAIGQHLIASKYAQTVVGAYNIANPTTDYVFVVGTGWDDSGTEHRADGFTVDWDGNGKFLGNISGVNGTYSGTLSVTDATTLSSTLSVSGVTTLSSTLDVTGATTLNNTLAVKNTATMRSINPEASATYSLGTSDYKWKDGYIQAVHTDNTVAAVTAINAGSLPSLTYSYDSSTETMTISWAAGSLPSVSATGSAVQAM